MAGDARLDIISVRIVRVVPKATELMSSPRKGREEYPG